MATFKLKRLPQPTLRMKALPRFPARLQGGDGVTVTQSGGVFTFSLDPGFTPSFTDALPFAAGDILYASGAASVTRLAAAAAGQALLSGATPAWGKVGLTTHVAGVLPAANGGTGVANAGTITLGGALVTGGRAHHRRPLSADADGDRRDQCHAADQRNPGDPGGQRDPVEQGPCLADHLRDRDDHGGRDRQRIVDLLEYADLALDRRGGCGGRSIELSQQHGRGRQPDWRIRALRQ